MFSSEEYSFKNVIIYKKAITIDISRNKDVGRRYVSLKKLNNFIKINIILKFNSNISI